MRPLKFIFLERGRHVLIVLMRMALKRPIHTLVIIVVLVPLFGM